MKRAVLAIVLIIVFPAAAMAGDGTALFKAKCASCHGADGKGQTPIAKKMPMRDLGSPEVQKQSDAELYAWTAEGKNKMPSYKGKLSDDDIKAVVAFMRTFK